jgi:branched-chain amino acid transport system ATP-binding protein
MPENTLLELRAVTKRFGQVVITDDLSFAVGPGDSVGIVGPNGAGKTSLFGLISGDLAPNAGEIYFAGHKVTKLDSAARTRLGIGRTYQVPRPFVDMTVFENVLVAAQQGGGLRRKASYTRAVDCLERTGIGDVANTPTSRLGLLQRKRLEVARALASGPKMLLLDEVAGGLTDAECGELIQIIRGILADGVAVIWIEHVVRALTQVAERLICLYGGHFIGDGDPASVMANPEVREVYLGSEVTASVADPAGDRANSDTKRGVVLCLRQQTPLQAPLTRGDDPPYPPYWKSGTSLSTTDSSGRSRTSRSPSTAARCTP